MKNLRLLLGITLIGIHITTVSSISFASSPDKVPAGISAPIGGYFSEYFQNIAKGCIPSGLITGFEVGATNYLTPKCSTLGDLIDNDFITKLFSHLFFRTTLVEFIKNNTVPSQWGNITGGIAYTGGRVAIGTENLDGKLHIAGGKVSLGETTEDFLPIGGSNPNWNYNLQFNGKDNTSIGFHDSMASVSSIRYNNDGFMIGGDDGWGTKSVTIPGGVKGLPAPVDANDGTNKAYVDAKVGATGGGGSLKVYTYDGVLLGYYLGINFVGGAVAYSDVDGYMKNMENSIFNQGGALLVAKVPIYFENSDCTGIKNFPFSIVPVLGSIEYQYYTPGVYSTPDHRWFNIPGYQISGFGTEGAKNFKSYWKGSSCVNGTFNGILAGSVYNPTGNNIGTEYKCGQGGCKIKP